MFQMATASKISAKYGGSLAILEAHRGEDFGDIPLISSADSGSWLPLLDNFLSNSLREKVHPKGLEPLTF